MAGVLAIKASADPAVSSVNGKVAAFGGASAFGNTEGGIGGIAGSLTLPLSYSYGLQLDGAYARTDNDNFGSGGAHVFWRDPNVGMLGVYGGYAYLDAEGGQGIGRAGAEGQYFFGNLTLDGAGGYRFGDGGDTPYGRVRLQYYPLDNVMLQAGYAYESTSFATGGIEYQFTSSKDYGLSIFGDGRVQDDDTYTVLAGLKVFLGENMSLKDRHRRQDPDDYSQSDLEAAFNAAIAAERARIGQAPPDDDTFACSISAGAGNPVTGGAPSCACPGGTANAGQSPTLLSSAYYCSPGQLSSPP